MPIFDPTDTIAKTPTSIGAIQYEFVDTTGSAEGIVSGLIVTVLDQNNEPLRVVRLRNLSNHLTATEKTRLLALFTRLRGEAVKELL